MHHIAFGTVEFENRSMIYDLTTLKFSAISDR